MIVGVTALAAGLGQITGALAQVTTTEPATTTTEPATTSTETSATTTETGSTTTTEPLESHAIDFMDMPTTTTVQVIEDGAPTTVILGVSDLTG